MNHDPNYWQMTQWLNKHRRHLQAYQNQYIAFNQQGIITSHPNLENVLAEARQTGKLFLIDFIPTHLSWMRILTLKIRAVSRHDWTPSYPVILKHREVEMPTAMIVDSGADISVISWQLGQQLGYQLADAESILPATVIGGTVNLVMRDIAMTIDGHTFMAPVAWLQQPSEGVILLGREGVFELFDIEFKQAEETIVFKWRKN